MAENSNITIEQRFNQLQKAKEMSQSSPYPKIQRVAHHLRDRAHFTKHYIPRLISLGPIHYGSPKLEQGEHYKQIWASRYIDTTEQTSQTLYHKVEANLQNLKDHFDADLFSSHDHFLKYHNQGFKNMEEMICWTLLVDGCALLHILEKAKLHPPNDIKVKIDQLVLVMQDVLLLENQLPFTLLKLLWRTNEEGTLIEQMKTFLQCHHWATEGQHKVIIKNPSGIHHLLDLQRTIIVYDPHPKETTVQIQNNNTEMVKHRNIKELRAAGIRLKTSKTRRPIDISFSSGCLSSELTLPEIVVDDTTANTVLNLIAYEMCPDFENDYGISSYVSFLDSLIDHPEDVKALRSERILFNSLGSDDDVAKLFNIIGTDSVPDMGKYQHLRTEIEKHYNSKWKTWFALGYHTHFSNPWTIIAIFAAALGLTLTFIQTWYAIYPSKN